jgi:hypothetical protein
MMLTPQQDHLTDAGIPARRGRWPSCIDHEGGFVSAFSADAERISSLEHVRAGVLAGARKMQNFQARVCRVLVSININRIAVDVRAMREMPAPVRQR